VFRLFHLIIFVNIVTAVARRNQNGQERRLRSAEGEGAAKQMQAIQRKWLPADGSKPGRLFRSEESGA
jgi:hypothetical protein